MCVCVCVQDAVSVASKNWASLTEEQKAVSDLLLYIRDTLKEDRPQVSVHSKISPKLSTKMWSIIQHVPPCDIIIPCAPPTYLTCMLLRDLSSFGRFLGGSNFRHKLSC